MFLKISVLKIVLGFFEFVLKGWNGVGVCVRDSSGKPTARHERGLVADSPTTCPELVEGLW